MEIWGRHGIAGGGGGASLQRVINWEDLVGDIRNFLIILSVFRDAMSLYAEDTR